ncbi:tryptophan dimethylallyltransferase-domain-containing protein [Fusarium flagelliforme]|uniref:tryptophan dimethylallyltransferase-domain-containing protein n=1 Tax=Fusarium flagelliforme TaxID=2675880 RepID=UPI001E8EF138|nr:tryptophan dimethylallyltransferase-domain-containing protein [Fusarium flagelliforme]KAH7183657.1 tryptophan dimethylallyltransferase-domain-containing protein [Fusarium flagelliforme]
MATGTTLTNSPAYPAASLGAAVNVQQTTPRHDVSFLVGRQKAPVWQKINKWLPPRDAHQDFWWDVTGQHLATMLHEAGYPLSRQYECLMFHYYIIVPRMGPRPGPTGQPTFKSFMTDDFSPIEYSWKWGDTDNDPPGIRLSVEHIGPNAGTALDLYNRESTINVLDHLNAADISIDPVWFKAFLHDFDPHNISTNTDEGDWGSSLFTAYELGAEKIAVKAYFIPRTQSVCQEFFSHGFKRAMKNVYGTDSSYLSAFATLSDFLTSDPEGQKLQMIILGIDCVAPEKSRIKVYMRTPSTSINHIISILSLGGRRPLSQVSIDEIRDLWRATLSLNDTMSDDEDLPSLNHETSGMLFYFDIKPSSKLPDVKGYIPVRHYGKTDLSIANGLIGFLERHNRAKYKDRYIQMLEGISQQADILSSRGIHTYISFGIGKDGHLQLTSYFSPQIYRRIAEAKGIGR